MFDYAQDAGFALFLWWSSTGLVLYLNGLAEQTFPRSLFAATLVALLAIGGVVWSADQDSVAGAYIGFTCGLLLYAWQELSYYMGFVTGPRKILCQPGCRGWRHFGHALQANLYHEAATIAGAALLIVLVWDAPNQVAMWTYVLLWFMQLSAKLNVFLGVRNLSEEFLPTHMEHLKSFLKQRPMNPLFPFSVLIGSALTVWLAGEALAAEPGTFTAAGWTFLASLMALAVLEHWFLVLPFSATGLWQWWLDRRDADAKSMTATRPPARPRRDRGSQSCLAHSVPVQLRDTNALDQPVFLRRRHEH